MIVRDIYLPKYDWHARVYFAISKYNIEDVARSLREIDCPERILRQAIRQMVRGEVNTGFTYSNKRRRRTVMLVGKTDTGEEFLNSFSHEQRHLCDDIANAFGMHMSGEEVAYLTGDISLKLADIVCHYSCDHCRDHD